MNIEGMSGEKLGGIQSEQEILLPRNLKLKITGSRKHLSSNALIFTAVPEE